MTLFKLISVFELTVSDQDVERPVRIEILQSTEDPRVYRPRVWVRNTYNVYPMSVNTGPKGEDLHSMHSCDDFNTDVSTLLAEDESFFAGKVYDSECQVLEYALSRVKELYK